MVLQDDDEIRRRQRGLAGVFAPLGDSSEDSQLLEELLYESYTYEKKTPGNKGMKTTGFTALDSYVSNRLVNGQGD